MNMHDAEQAKWWAEEMACLAEADRKVLQQLMEAHLGTEVEVVWDTEMSFGDDFAETLGHTNGIDAMLFLGAQPVSVPENLATRTADTYFVGRTGTLNGLPYVYGGFGCSMQSAIMCLFVRQADAELWRAALTRR